ncbi:hypothetical protein [Stenotrophomonas phage BUCT555]|nr:hypothetical protein [Stenotrophomonas phage BUCT555]
MNAAAEIYIPGHPVDRRLLITAIRTCIVLGLIRTSPEEVPLDVLYRIAVAVGDEQPDTIDQALGGDGQLFAPIYGFADAPTLDQSVYLFSWAVKGLMAAAEGGTIDMANLNIISCCTGLADRVRRLPPLFHVNDVTEHNAELIGRVAGGTESPAAHRLQDMWTQKCNAVEENKLMDPWRQQNLEQLIAAIEAEGQTAH